MISNLPGSDGIVYNIDMISNLPGSDGIVYNIDMISNLPGSDNTRLWIRRYETLDIKYNLILLFIEVVPMVICRYIN